MEKGVWESVGVGGNERNEDSDCDVDRVEDDAGGVDSDWGVSGVDNCGECDGADCGECDGAGCGVMPRSNVVRVIVAHKYF